MSKKHYQPNSKISIGVCNNVMSYGNTTSDIKQVTCKSCLKVIEKGRFPKQGYVVSEDKKEYEQRTFD